jgi:hypothetical protein
MIEYAVVFVGNFQEVRATAWAETPGGAVFTATLQLVETVKTPSDFALKSVEPVPVEEESEPEQVYSRKDFASIFCDNVSANHPEAGDDKVFVCNVGLGEKETYAIEHKRWSSLSFGRVAYDITGRAMHGLVPVFVSREEFYGRGFELRSDGVGVKR